MVHGWDEGGIDSVEVRITRSDGRLVVLQLENVSLTTESETHEHQAFGHPVAVYRTQEHLSLTAGIVSKETFVRKTGDEHKIIVVSADVPRPKRNIVIRKR